MSSVKVVPPFPPENASLPQWFAAFNQLVEILRKECPWDRKQTHESISHLLIEESYETIEAIQRGDDDELSKELGDLLLHVAMHSVIAAERGAFSIQSVIEQIFHKLVHRHPHVFGDAVAEDDAAVKQRWEESKMKEGRTSILQGVPTSMPALLRAQRIQEKASGVGFDWSDKNDVWDKVEEEIGELRQAICAQNQEDVNGEFGDVLFALTNAARFENIPAENALQTTNEKFSRRFLYIEQESAKNGKKLSDMTLGEMDALWNEAKTKGI